MTAVNLAEAKSRLSELVRRSLAGETITLMVRGEPQVTLTPVRKAKPKIDFEWLQRMTADIPYQDESAGDFMERHRDDERY